MNLLRLLFLVALLWAGNSFAHQPYAHKKSIIKAPDGQPLAVEFLYGDGIISTDPMRVQVRNHKGAVIASSPTFYRARLQCEELASCAVLAYGVDGLVVERWQLDTQGLDYQKPLSPEKIKFKNKIEQYLQEGDVLRDYFLGYPEMMKDSNGFVLVSSSVWQGAQIFIWEFFSIIGLMFFFLLPWLLIVALAAVLSRCWQLCFCVRLALFFIVGGLYLGCCVVVGSFVVAIGLVPLVQGAAVAGVALVLAVWLSRCLWRSILLEHHNDEMDL